MKPFAVYGSVPRGSKTSTKEVVCGLPLFYHCSNAETSGNIVVYYNKKPFPRLFVAAGMTYWDCKAKADAYVKKHYLDILQALQKMNINFGIPRADMDKLAKGSSYEYEIVEGLENKKDCMKLYTPWDNDECKFYYLYAYPNEVPKDISEILSDFKQRKKLD